MADAMGTAEDASELMCAVRDAMCALDCSIQSILCDEDITNKVPSITTSYSQFKDHIASLGLEDLKQSQASRDPRPHAVLECRFQSARVARGAMRPGEVP